MRRGVRMLLLAMPVVLVVVSGRMASSTPEELIGYGKSAREQVVATNIGVVPAGEGVVLILVGAALIALAAVVRRIA